MCRPPSPKSVLFDTKLTSTGTGAAKLDPDAQAIDRSGQRNMSKMLNHLGSESYDASRVSSIVGTQARRSSEETDVGDLLSNRRPSVMKAMEQQGVAYTDKAAGVKGNAPTASCCLIM